jgi:hypothetical protein
MAAVALDKLWRIRPYVAAADVLFDLLTRD